MSRHEQLADDVVNIKLLCLGDSAVGKSKLVQRFLLDFHQSDTTSTFGVQIHKYNTNAGNRNVCVSIWDTAGQNAFERAHPAYYYRADVCLLIFDATRRQTYKNLSKWYNELRQYLTTDLPVLCAVNKIDLNLDVTTKSFAFANNNNLPMYYVSASDGTNVVKLFHDAIRCAVNYTLRENIERQIFQELDRM